jgi:hypothetical protein
VSFCTDGKRPLDNNAVGCREIRGSFFEILARSAEDGLSMGGFAGRTSDSILIQHQRAVLKPACTNYRHGLHAVILFVFFG